MNDFLKMDIFFAVVTVETLVIAALFGFVLWRILKILEQVERIAKAAGDEAQNFKSDVAFARGKIYGVVDALTSFIPRRRSRAGARTEREESNAGETGASS